MSIERSFISLNNGNQIHYRTAGNGAPLVMLHPSPQCSEMLIPAISKFSEFCTCYALDTPGYGLSHDINVDEPILSDYVPVLMEAIDNLGIEKFALYGSATGGQIAIEIAKTYPDRIALLMLDTNGHFNDDEIRRIENGYFPSVKPVADGSHLQTYWDMCRRLYVAFPWHSRREEDQLNLPSQPAEITHSVFLRYLNAGETYAKAYRAALFTEHFDHIKDVKVPTTILRWQGSILLEATDELIAKGLEDNFIILDAGPSIENRYSVQLEALKNMYSAKPYKKPILKDNDKIGFFRKFYKSEKIYLSYLYNNIHEGKPLVIIHQMFGSADIVKQNLPSSWNSRPLYIIDMPNHGESSGFDETVSMNKFAEPIQELLNNLDINEFDILAFGSGAIVALELSKRMTIRKSTLVDPITYNQSNSIDDKIIELKKDGSHVLQVWKMAIETELNSSWHTNKDKDKSSLESGVEAKIIHENAISIFKSIQIQENLVRIMKSHNIQDDIFSAASDPEVLFTSIPPKEVIEQFEGQNMSVKFIKNTKLLWHNLL